MSISIPVFVIHHDPSIWSEPETFRPERFLKDEESSIQACSWLPFGGGPRQCIGLCYFRLPFGGFLQICSLLKKWDDMKQVSGLPWWRWRSRWRSFCRSSALRQTRRRSWNSEKETSFFWATAKFLSAFLRGEKNSSMQIQIHCTILSYDQILVSMSPSREE